MSDSTDSKREDGSGKSGDARRARLAASLRENLKRRKTQQRQRDTAAEKEAPARGQGT